MIRINRLLNKAYKRSQQDKARFIIGFIEQEENRTYRLHYDLLEKGIVQRKEEYYTKEDEVLARLEELNQIYPNEKESAVIIKDYGWGD